jgi:hypothetical protein
MDHKENDQDQQSADAKTLVTTLTNLLLNDPTPQLGMDDRPVAESMQTADARGDADRVLTGFTSNSSLNDVSPNGDRRTPPTPAFLEDRQVREALLRANSLRPQGHLDDEPHFPSSFMGTHSRLRAAEGEWGGALGDLPLNDPLRVAYPLVAYPDTSYAPRSPALNQARPEMGTRFQPGQETASVLQITKRPRLRPKDVSHRQSLGNTEQSSSLPVTPARNFMVNLMFGARRVSFYGSVRTSVDEIFTTAGNITEMDPSLLRIPHLCAPHLFSCAPHTFLAFSLVLIFGCSRFGSDPN